MLSAAISGVCVGICLSTVSESSGRWLRNQREYRPLSELTRLWDFWYPCWVEAEKVRQSIQAARKAVNRRAADLEARDVVRKRNE